ncbi:MAG: polyprenyl synthetase family protein [Lachnospirales bacterium]
MDNRSEINAFIEFVNKELINNLINSSDIETKTLESMVYSLEAGGKRLRPLLLMTSFLHFNKDLFSFDEILPFVLAIEYIHTYSLIHDDLPAMDNDDMRRGKPTNHIVYGEALAILSGDGLLNFAFETVAKGFKEDFTLVKYQKYVKSLDLLSSCSGTKGMIKGQVLDVFSNSKIKNLELLKEIHLNKTGKLFKAPICIGGILADVSDEQYLILDELADLVGLAFQIQDDLLDYISSEDELGKPIGSDEKNDKLTYVTFLGIKKSKELFMKTKNDVIDTLEKLQAKDSLFGYMIIKSINKIK